MNRHWVPAISVLLWAFSLPAAMADEAEERLSFEKEFEEKYTATIEVYETRQIARSTLLELITPEIRSYFLMSKSALIELLGGDEGTLDEFLRGMRRDSGIKILREGEHHILMMSLDPPRTEGISVISPLDDSAFAMSLRATQQRITADRNGERLIVTAIPETHEKIRQTLAKVNALVATEGIRDQGSGQGFRVEAILLQGGKAGQEIAGAARGIGLAFAQTGIIEELPKIGAKVKAGEVIGRLQSIDLDARIEAMELSLKEAEAQVTIGGQNGASSAEKTEARSIVGQVKIQLKALEASRSAYLLVSPLSGTIASIPVRRNQTFDPQEIVAFLIPDGQENATTPAPSFDRETAERYGISKEDMELFDFDGVVVLGKTVVTLSKGDRFDFSLGGDYWCRLWVLEVREPYVILNGELGHDQRGTQLESRFYLQKGKPSVVGVTNLNEAIILVLRLLDSP